MITHLEYKIRKNVVGAGQRTVRSREYVLRFEDMPPTLSAFSSLLTRSSTSTRLPLEDAQVQYAYMLTQAQTWTRAHTQTIEMKPASSSAWA
jgi:hypothetical protein